MFVTASAFAPSMADVPVSVLLCLSMCLYVSSVTMAVSAPVIVSVSNGPSDGRRGESQGRRGEEDQSDIG